MLEVIYVSLVVTFIYLFEKYQKLKKPAFITVNTKKEYKLTRNEQRIIDYMMKEGYYVSCRVPCGSKVIPLALIPFQLALLPKKRSKIKTILLRVYMQLHGWKVYTLYFDGSDKELKKLKEIIDLEKKSVLDSSFKHVQ